MRRPSYAIFIGLVSLLVINDGPVGGFIDLGGTELGACRKANWLAMLRGVSNDERSDLIARVGVVRSLIPRIGAEEFYLSKMGVVAAWRGAGLGRRIALEFLTMGRAAGFLRFRLDV